ncbi:MAG: sigma-70 family RNA polymerase sigma factor [Cyclobacteriaceae bacterium]|nr:sigma-70 family RNA polymerase sigma factor [Cyclobacteriaceae bacterium]
MPISPYEQDLIQKCYDGDRTAYRELYTRFAGELMAVAMRYMKTKQEAEDVLQDAFIKAYKNLASFNQQSALKTWLTRIVINTALNALRKEHQKYQWNIMEAEEVHDTTSLPLESFHYTELIAFIQQLPDGCRTVFNLYALEGYSHKEIADMINISMGTSKSQYFRAKQLLQEIILSEDAKTKRKAI